MKAVARIFAHLVTAFTRLLTGAQARGLPSALRDRPRVYFANHSSHADFAVIWAALPARLRARTRPVAGADYWQAGALRSWVIGKVLNGVLVERNRKEPREHDSTEPLVAALDAGDSLILFPEGTRNATGERLLAFKSGIFRLAARRPEIEFIPVWLDNSSRVLPKGASIPVPFLCTVTFGAPVWIAPGEEKTAFIDRARQALLALAAPGHRGQEASTCLP